MPGTYSTLLYHIVFATKHREPHITDDIAERLRAYIGGIIREASCELRAIGGVEDHLHICIRTRTDLALSDLMRAIKAKSSRWIHETFPDLAAFAWQEGYAAFTVSASREADVRAYIARQREHHAREDFRTELLRILRAHGVEFDERYVLD